MSVFESGRKLMGLGSENLVAILFLIFMFIIEAYAKLL